MFLSNIVLILDTFKSCYKMKRLLVVFITFCIFGSCSDDSIQENNTVERLTIGSISPSRVRIGEIVTVNGTRMDLIDKIILFNEEQEDSLYDYPWEIWSNHFESQSESEISFKMRSFFQDNVMVEFQNVDKTIKKIELIGWIPTLHDFSSIKLVETPSSEVGFLYDGNKVYISEDGFLNWNSIFESSNPISNIHFIDESTGWIVEEDYTNDKSKFYLTEDGGSSFNLDFEIIMDGWIFNMEFVSKNKGFVVDTKQNMYVYENGKVIDFVDYYPEFDPAKIGGLGIFDFRILDENNLFIVPTDGDSNMQKLSNGQMIDLKFRYNQNLPQFIEETGYCLGDNNKLYKSLDRGDSWSEIMVFEGPYSTVHFLDKNHGFVKTGWRDNDAEQLETIDGGLNWKKSEIELQGGLNGLSVAHSVNYLISIKHGNKLFRYVE